MNEHIVIISGSAPLADHVVDAIPDDAIVLAADGALDLARAAGLEPGGLIGDLDSVSAAGLAWAEQHATIARHPTDKDRTDTELALEFAADMDPARLTLIGGGDRLDHTIAAIGALGADVLTSVPVLDGFWNGQHLDVLHGPGREELLLRTGSEVSLLALHGRCTGVTIQGVRWPLEAATIGPTVGLGISNEVVATVPTDPMAPTDPTDPTVDGRTDAGDPTATIVSLALSTGILTVFDHPAHREHRVRT